MVAQADAVFRRVSDLDGGGLTVHCEKCYDEKDEISKVQAARNAQRRLSGCLAGLSTESSEPRRK